MQNQMTLPMQNQMMRYIPNQHDSIDENKSAFADILTDFLINDIVNYVVLEYLTEPATEWKLKFNRVMWSLRDLSFNRGCTETSINNVYEIDDYLQHNLDESVTIDELLFEETNEVDSEGYRIFRIRLDNICMYDILNFEDMMIYDHDQFSTCFFRNFKIRGDSQYNPLDLDYPWLSFPEDAYKDQIRHL
jgi:hypothetical protein